MLCATGVSTPPSHPPRPQWKEASSGLQGELRTTRGLPGAREAIWMRSEALRPCLSAPGGSVPASPWGTEGGQPGRPCLEASPGLACGPSISIVHPFASTLNGPSY